MCVPFCVNAPNYVVLFQINPMDFIGIMFLKNCIGKFSLCLSLWTSKFPRLHFLALAVHLIVGYFCNPVWST